MTRFQYPAALSATAASCAVCLGIAAMPASAGTPLKVLYSFQGDADGSQPYAGLARDTAGNLYGTTEQGGTDGFGTVFEMTPNGDGTYAYESIFSLTGGPEGIFPQGSVAIDGAGNLYVTASGGGTHDGSVFELSPDGNGGFNLSNSFVFNGVGPNGNDGDGALPSAAVILDADGNIFGTCEQGGAGNIGVGYGTVFELSPSRNGWKETTLHRFGDSPDGSFPHGSLVMDKAGDLYGTTPDGGNHGFGGYGTIFRLHQTKKGWAESILYNFTGGADGMSPASNLIRDKAGNLYGTTALDIGTVFRLAPPAAKGADWTLATLYQFADIAGDGGYPYSGVVFDKTGNLYGTTYINGDGTGHGVVYELTPAQTGPWKETLLWNFTGGGDGKMPFATLIFDMGEKHLLGTTSSGGAGGNGTNGTVFALKR